jgi:hypothetical protein
MPYLGTPPQSGFISQEANQYFTGLTQNYIDLNQSISSLSSVIILVNGVVQENSTMSLTSSTRITLGDTLVSADKVTCIYVAKISSTQAPAIGSVTNDMLSGSIANSKLANSSITLNGSAVSLGGSATVGGDNTPAFHVYLSSNQGISNETDTKVQFDTEVFDTNNAFDNSTNYRFTPQVAGKYFFYLTVMPQASSIDNNIDYVYCELRKNGSATAGYWNILDFRSDRDGRKFSVSTCGILDMDGSSDYVEGWGTLKCNSGTREFGGAHRETFFGGYKIIT